MKLIKKAIGKDAEGSITFQAEESEDMYHLYNLIAKGDRISGTTIRNVSAVFRNLFIIDGFA